MKNEEEKEISCEYCGISSPYAEWGKDGACPCCGARYAEGPFVDLLDDEDNWD